LNGDYSNTFFLLECSQFKRNRRNISHFAEKKRPWNQALKPVSFELLTRINYFYLIAHNSKETGEIFRREKAPVESGLKNCNFGSLEDELIRDRVVYGIKSERVRERLLLERELTLDKALKYVK
jgi:hypothetical protein